MKVHRTFVGLRKSDAHPHLLEHFTKGMKYLMHYEEGFRFAHDDTGKKIMISNNARKTYFV